MFTFCSKRNHTNEGTLSKVVHEVSHSSLSSFRVSSQCSYPPQSHPIQTLSTGRDRHHHTKSFMFVIYIFDLLVRVCFTTIVPTLTFSWFLGFLCSLINLGSSFNNISFYIFTPRLSVYRISPSFTMILMKKKEKLFILIFETPQSRGTFPPSRSQGLPSFLIPSSVCSDMRVNP
jgi:hypothetical protein